jgi:hypothetical protein
MALGWKLDLAIHFQRLENGKEKVATSQCRRLTGATVATC